jgi:AraC-like DNA-binding protein/quercetin dioxygenase-like cupin family protein
MSVEYYREQVILSGTGLFALAADYADKHVNDFHSHECCQLIYAIQGVMRIEAEGGIWVVPPTRGVWLKEGVSHRVTMCGEVRMRTVYVESSSVPHMTEQCSVLDIGPLLRELIVAAVDASNEEAANARKWHLSQLILHELRSVPVLPLYLPMPQDIRLLGLCEQLLQTPDLDLTLNDWAEQLHISTRTLHRLFQRETGMRLGEWRRQARLLLALERIAAGTRIVNVALEHGYTSQSAFAAMFKKHFGVSPSAFYK